MREMCEFRIAERYAHYMFAPNEGKRLGDSVRKIEIATDDPRFKKIGELQSEIRAKTAFSFFYGWRLRRYYSNEELEDARLFRLKITCAFEPAGEECGTTYDESSACQHCGAGAKQISDLFLSWKKLPKRADIARTIAGEMIVSRKIVELFRDYAIKGAEFRPVRYWPSSSAESQDRHQLFLKSCSTKIVSPTQTGVDPFDKDVEDTYRCPRSDLIGLTLISEAWVKVANESDLDITASTQFVGIRRGLLRPERLIFISPKLRCAIKKEGVKGLQLEVAHVR
jgi:hypothetical protein